MENSYVKYFFASALVVALAWMCVSAVNTEAFKVGALLLFSLVYATIGAILFYALFTCGNIHFEKKEIKPIGGITLFLFAVYVFAYMQSH